MIVLPFPSAMSTASSLIPTAVQSLHFSTYKVGGAYRKPLGGRKRAEFIRTLHDPTPKRWELKQPRGVKHDEQKIQRQEKIQKNLKSVARQMPDRLRKYPKRDQRIGHQWFRPTFDQTALKYFRLRGVEAISLGEKAAKFHDPMTHVEVALHYMQKTGMKVPPADKPKLLVTLEKKLAGTSSESDGAGKKEKKKKQKK